MPGKIDDVVNSAPGRIRSPGNPPARENGQEIVHRGNQIKSHPVVALGTKDRPNLSGVALCIVHYGYRTTADPISGSGMDPVSSGMGTNRPALQSSFACSIRSFELETKFHQM